MNILVVTPSLPLPTWGAGIRNHHLLAALAREHRVTLLALVEDPDAARDDLAEVQRIVPETHLVALRSGREKRVAQVQSLLTNRSYLLSTFSPAAARQTLADLVRAAGCELILFESVVVAGLRPERDANGERAVKVVIDQHNVEHEILQRTFQSEPSPLRKWYNWAEAHALKRRELALCRDADGVIFTSERDRATMQQLVDLRATAVVPNGVDVASFVPADPSARVPGRVVFTGTMGYYPNVQAALFFAERCWPLIREQMPEATWEVVGSRPPREILALEALPGVTVTGAVPDVRPRLAAASVAVAPLLIGGGTRLKILEAFATATPVVSTHVGCEGLSVTPGEHLLVEDDAPAFAEAVLRLLKDAPLRERLGRTGRALAEAEYGWDRCGDQLISFIETVRSDRRALIAEH